LRGSYVPAAPQRELRELTRQRRQLIQTKSSVANRIQKVLEDANIKLASVASNVLGASGRDMLRALVVPVRRQRSSWRTSRGRLRDKIPALREALEGRVTDHHRFLLRLLLDELTSLEGLIDRVSARIGEVLPAGFEEAIGRLTTSPPLPDFSHRSTDPYHDAGQQRFGSSHPAQFNAVFADGAVHHISYSIDPMIFSHLGDLASGDVIPSTGDW
jgi:hypothetical protein